MLNLKVVMTCESKKDTECGISDSRSKAGGVVNVLHVTPGNKVGLVLDNVARAIALDLVLPRAANEAHWRNERNKMPSAFGGEGGEFLVKSSEPLGLFRAFHNLFV